MTNPHSYSPALHIRSGDEFWWHGILWRALEDSEARQTKLGMRVRVLAGRIGGPAMSLDLAADETIPYLEGALTCPL